MPFALHNWIDSGRYTVLLTSLFRLPATPVFQSALVLILIVLRHVLNINCSDNVAVTIACSFQEVHVSLWIPHPLLLSRPLEKLAMLPDLNFIEDFLESCSLP